MTTVRELFTEDREFLCPECKRICNVDNDIDVDNSDGVEVKCSCGAKQEFWDMDDEVDEPSRYHGHRVGFTNNGIVCCKDCDMRHLSIDYYGCSKAVYNLYRLGKYKDVECGRNSLLEDLVAIARGDLEV